MEGTIGEIRLFAGTFAPKNWAYCAGQLLSIAQNTALFSILGTTYGGNGTTTFALPDLRGRTAVGAGQGPGLSFYQLGEMTGTEKNTLLISNLASHNHAMLCNGADGSGTENSPANNFWGVGPINRSTNTPVNTRYATTPDASMNPMEVGVTGNSQPVNNIMPSLGMNYIICMYGIFPSRN